MREINPDDQSDAMSKVSLRKVGAKKVVFLVADTNREDLVHMTELHAAGKVVPVVDRTYPLSEAASSSSDRDPV